MPELLKTWKVRPTGCGVVLTLNGKAYQLGTSSASVAFELARAALTTTPGPVDVDSDAASRRAGR